MRYLHAGLLVLFVVVVAVFCFQNLKTVDVAFLGWSASVPLALLVVVTYVLGMATGGGLISFLRRSYRGVREAKQSPV